MITAGPFAKLTACVIFLGIVGITLGSFCACIMAPYPLACVLISECDSDELTRFNERRKKETP